MARHIPALAFAPESALAADVVIVGSGPAGTTLACELSGKGLRILVLESGGLERDAAADRLNEVENIGWPRIEDQWLARNRILGGSSHTWSGRCVPFDAIDFASRPWIAHSGWPLRREALTPYLDRAAGQLGLAPAIAFLPQEFWRLARRRSPLPAFDESRLIAHLWQFARDRETPRDYTRFGPRLRLRAGDDVTLLTRATLCDIILNEAGTALQSVEAAGVDGTRRRIAARALVLCAGGIENPRLLLNADQKIPGGVGNRHGQVGRYLMDHLRGPTAQFPRPGTAVLRRRLGHYRIAGGPVFALGLRLGPVAQRQEALVNCAAWLEGRMSDDDPFLAARRLAKGELRALPALLRHAPLFAAGLHNHLIARNGLLRKIDRLDLVCMCEQLPDPDSRVTLSAQRDALGQRRARIDWRVHEAEVRTLRRMTELVAAEFARLRWPVPEPDAWIADGGALPRAFRDVAHPIGTTRMGCDPTSSVVDRNCELHGISGIFVAGSSVFPTSGHANPTLMIVALALRLAETIDMRLRMPAARRAPRAVPV